MGPVFRAYDPEGERLVAVKLFKLDLPPERIHQLVDEFEKVVSARLVQPAIATPVATGIVEASAYLAQEFVPAESLDTVVREHGALPVPDALRVAEQLAGALDFAAAAGVNHGGLHPRDVLLAGDQAKLAGLGVVHALEQVGAATPVRRPYTAPERIGGTAWGSRADVFSLAALVHEMLWARRVSGMGEAAAESLSEIPGGDLGQLKAAFARALDESPDARFDTAGEFVLALQRAFCEQPPAVVEAPVTSDQRPVTSDQRPVTSDQPPATSKVNIRQSRRVPRLSPIERAASAADRRPLDSDEPRLPLDAPSMVRERQERKTALAPVALTAAALPVAETTLPGNWPLAFALAIGVAVGFAAGYGVGARTRSTTSQATVATPVELPATNAPVVSATVPAPAQAPAPLQAAAPPSVSEARAPLAAPPAARAAERRPEAAKAVPPATGSVMVRSTPVGARVAVDGKDYGRTPLTVRELSRGVHRVQVSRDGYATEERRLTITAAKAPTLSVQLSRARVPAAPAVRKPSTAPAVSAPAGPPTAAAGRGPGPLIVESRPPGAKVYLDGRLVGTTPVSVPGVAAGDHAVRLEHEGYRNWSSPVRVEGSEPSRVTASLEK